jgi:hypothetical protein
LLFFNESGHFELKLNEKSVLLKNINFFKSKLSVKEIFRKYFICFVPQDLKTIHQLNNKKNADKYLSDHFDAYYSDISE